MTKNRQLQANRPCCQCKRPGWGKDQALVASCCSPLSITSRTPSKVLTQFMLGWMTGTESFWTEASLGNRSLSRHANMAICLFLGYWLDMQSTVCFFLSSHLRIHLCGQQKLNLQLLCHDMASPSLTNHSKRPNAYDSKKKKKKMQKMTL